MSSWSTMSSRSDLEICTEIDDLLEGYALGALEPDEMLRVAEAIQSCPEQARKLAEYEETVGYVGLAVEREATPPDIWQRLESSIRPANVPAPFSIARLRDRSMVVPRWAMAAAAALVLILLVSTISLGVALRQSNSDDSGDNSFESTLAYYATSGAEVIHLYSKDAPDYLGWDGKGVLIMSPGMDPLLVVDNCVPSGNGMEYVVWLAIGETRTPMGQITIDENGRGMMALTGVASLDQYDMLGVSLKTANDHVYDLIEGPPQQDV